MRGGILPSEPIGLFGKIKPKAGGVREAHLGVGTTPFRWLRSYSAALDAVLGATRIRRPVHRAAESHRSVEASHSPQTPQVLSGLPVLLLPVVPFGLLGRRCECHCGCGRVNWTVERVAVLADENAPEATDPTRRLRRLSAVGLGAARVPISPPRGSDSTNSGSGVMARCRAATGSGCVAKQRHRQHTVAAWHVICPSFTCHRSDLPPPPSANAHGGPIMQTTPGSRGDFAQERHPIGRGAATSAAKQISRGPAVIAGRKPEQPGGETVPRRGPYAEPSRRAQCGKSARCVRQLGDASPRGARLDRSGRRRGAAAVRLARRHGPK